MKHFHLFASLLLAVSVATFSTQASTPPRNGLNYSVLDGKTVKGDNKEEVKQSAPGITPRRLPGPRLPIPT